MLYYSDLGGEADGNGEGGGYLFHDLGLMLAVARMVCTISAGLMSRMRDSGVER